MLIDIQVISKIGNKKESRWKGMIVLMIMLMNNMWVIAQPSMQDQKVDHTVRIVGAMSNVMHKGELFATIDIDTISDKAYLVGLGPMENLSGEILILDGHVYTSTVTHDHEMSVTSTNGVKAPFFAYTHVKHWQDVMLPDSINTLPQLEHFLDQITQKFSRPFFFRVSAVADSAAIHVVNLPPGAKVSSPEDAHQASQAYIIRDKSVNLIGFFSTRHQGVFTHQGSFTHIHLITADHQQMGHLDSIKFKSGTRLLLPEL